MQQKKINWTSKLKLCASKDTIKKVKKMVHGMGEHIYKLYIWIRTFYPRMYKGLLQFNDKKADKPIKIWTKNLNRHLSNNLYKWTKKHVKRCSTSLIIGEMQINTITHLDG